MKFQIWMLTLIVIFGIILVESNQNEIETIRHLFDSIARNDTTGVKTYRQALKQEAVHKQEVFYAMKEQMRSLRKPTRKPFVFKREVLLLPNYYDLYHESQKKLNRTEEKLNKTEEEWNKKWEEVRKENWVVHCGQEQRYAIKYFEQLFSEAHNESSKGNLPDFKQFEYDERERRYQMHISGNPIVRLNKSYAVNFDNLDDRQKGMYHHEFHQRRLTQREKWIIGPKWLVQSVEYKLLVNGDKIRRLEALVDALKSGLKTDPTITITFFTFCILHNWDRLCHLVKVSPRGFDYKEVYEKLQILAGASSSLARHCSFLLEDIIKGNPLTEVEKESLRKFWTDESVIKFESWELDVDRLIPEPIID